MYQCGVSHATRLGRFQKTKKASTKRNSHVTQHSLIHRLRSHYFIREYSQMHLYLISPMDRKPTETVGTVWFSLVLVCDGASLHTHIQHLT